MKTFEAKAERKAENILRQYPYCLVTPLEIINEFGDAMPKESVKCTDIDEIRYLYETEDDIHIKTPDGCNY